ncbi:hypothetical protein [Pseudocolwellia agarivorans]|uniref:hypothetical protein n=1 Tax=Pseudocolwellia agarivorans TaxID=1911682 RepID=UPI000986C0AC|nr:hypothetical protein [Pseudocolwellia agarivorans]
MKNFHKALIVATTLGLVFTAQAKDVSKADWIKKQESNAQKKGKEMKSGALEKRWKKIDTNADGVLSKAEAMEAKKNRKKNQ